MADEIRRSGRATKGQHTKKDEPNDKTAKKKGRGRGKKTTEPEPEEEEEEESIIRCICGYIKEDEDDKRAMICCDKCEAWQHNVCMGMPTDEDDCPDQYYCEQCHPEDHKELLDGIKRGEKPWEERQARHEREEEEAKAKKKKGGRPPRKSKGLEIETQPAASSKAASPVVEKQPESGTKRKAPDLAVDTGANEKSSAKSRKVSTPQEAKPTKRRQSTAASASTPVRKDSKVPLQAELVENIADLQNASRQRAARALEKLFVDSIDTAQKEGTFKQSGQSSAEHGLRLALSVEYALYLNLWGNAEEPSSQYGAQLRAVLHNVKANPGLRNRLLKSQLSANELSQMSSFDMASKEKQEEAAKILKDAEKQHVLVNEQGGPRIRRTHKGDEVVEQDTGAVQTGSIYSSGAVHRPGDGQDKASTPPRADGSPEAVELPEEVSHSSGADGSATTARRPERTSSNFNIDSVWSSVDSPTTSKPRTSSTTQRPSVSAGVKSDPDIDHLLKDDEDEEYEPMEYEVEPGTIWRGSVQMATVAEFRGSAKFVAGADLSGVYPWPQLMPPTLYVEGRIDIEKASEYLCGLRFSNTTDVTVVALTPGDSADDTAQFEVLFEYFTKRQRYGVIGRSSIALVRDIYVVPLEAGEAPRPEFIELLKDCDIPSNRPKRSLLIVYVIKVRTNGAPAPGSGAGQNATTGKRNDYQGSPVPPQSSHFRTPSLPQGLMSPVAPQTQIPGQAGSPITQPFSPTPPQSQGAGLRGMAAAQAVLGPMAAEPVIPQLLAHSPNAGEWEFTHIKRAMEQEPETRQDLSKLMLSIQAMMKGAKV